MFENEKIPLMGNIYLRIGGSRSNYASCRIQKGLLLSFGDTDLAEEGTGFGVPVLKLGHEAIFPGSARINGQDKTFTVDYELNLAERLTVKGRKIKSRTFYRLKELLSSLHREFPCLRKLITHGFGTAGRAVGIETQFEEVPSFGVVRVLYAIRPGNIHISVDTSRVRKNNCKIMLMNEQGANYFDKYRDTDGLSLKGDAIGTWDETFADEAAFVDTSHKLGFTLQRVAGARIFRGRELVSGRLAWSGLAYSLPPDRTDFSYNISIGCR